MVEPSRDDGFKWFGEGFDGFPKHLPEDCVEYVVHVIDAKFNDVQLRERLQAFQRASNELAKKLLKDYIWQRDSFMLNLERTEGSWILHGQTNYGDSIADEWLIVYLLRETSKQFSDAWIRVRDSDGEFLLIEAANALPQWLNPEVADNRVWINEGKLLIIPEQYCSSAAEDHDSSRSLSLKDALDFLSKNKSKLIHSPLVEEEAFYRLRNYPSEISKSLHHAVITIPRKLAFILHEKPSYISPAIEAFYLRDPISLRPLHASSPENLHFPPDDFVTVSVRFNRVGYAQLYSQQFAAPRSWEGRLPEATDSITGRRIELGMKLTCGFEMLLSDRQARDKRTVREIQILLEDLENDGEGLPTDADIQAWSQQDDDDSWLDIDFTEFERELSGKGDVGEKPKSKDGFGDKMAQENLRKMVERFESFLNDDAAGAEGAQGLDEMDVDDEDFSDDSDLDSDGEDKNLSFDEDEFVKMMKEMMGMPVEQRGLAGLDKAEVGAALSKLSEIENSQDEDSEDDLDEIKKLSERMEAELNETGALNLDPTPKKLSALKSKSKEVSTGNVESRKGKDRATGEEQVEAKDLEVEDDEEDEEIDIDYNLAKNLLESFKGQAGMAGPTGNLLGLMGIKMPRDEGDNEKPPK